MCLKTAERCSNWEAYFSSPKVRVIMTSSSPGISLSCQVPSSRNSLTSGGKSSVSRVSFSNCSSDASFADSSGSTERFCQ